MSRTRKALRQAVPVSLASLVLAAAIVQFPGIQPLDALLSRMALPAARAAALAYAAGPSLASLLTAFLGALAASLISTVAARRRALRRASLAVALIALGAGAGLAAAGEPLSVLTLVASAALATGASLALRRSRLSRERSARQLARQARAAANQLKTEFLNHLTHELRTPLTAIMGFNKINQYTNELGKAQRIANSAIIARNCEHLLSLINNNLDLAKMEAGELSVTPTPQDPDQLFRDVLATVRALAQGKPIELHYTQASPLPEALLLDGSRLRQVLINLLGNAIKFTAHGRVELWAAWHLAALTIEVRDSGPGIAPQALERIWQPFRQADLTIGGRFGGTGLGLAISRRLVDLMGGEITVRSEPGKGSVFCVRLPSAIPAQAKAGPSQPAAPAGDAAGGAAGSAAPGPMAGRVLLADDNEDLRALVQLLLRRLGLSVTAVENGLAAVEQALEGRIDLVLMDLEMPVMNGYEATQVLRTRGFSGQIFGLTAHEEGPETARAILAGCDAVLHKPVSLQALQQALAPALARQRPDEPASPMERSA